VTTKQHNPQARKFGLANIILILGLGVLLCGEAWYGYHLQALSEQREQIKRDYSTLTSITFGLFSIDQWRDKIGEVINGKVSDFSVTPEQKKALKIQVEAQLNGIINKALADINKPQKSLMGRIKKLAVNKFVDEDQVHALVPSFAQTIVNKATSPASTQRVKNIVTSKVNELQAQTYDSTEVTAAAVATYMYHKYNAADSATFSREINSRLASVKVTSYNDMYCMLGCVLAALLLWLLMRNMTHLHATHFFMSLLFALVLLIVGVTSSVIEVDAQLSSFNLGLGSDNISFTNQDLFFQSKSIVEIIQTLVKQPKPDAVMVGILMLLFIIILPIVRIIAKGLHIIGNRFLSQNKVVMYLAFESAKWDMADVMVVGTLMTYIGLNGILRSQLTEIEFHTSGLNTTTGNFTSLQPGYFIFVGYVVFAIILAAILNRIRPRDQRSKAAVSIESSPDQAIVSIS
jgi:hypothetical protein